MSEETLELPSNLENYEEPNNDQENENENEQANNDNDNEQAAMPSADDHLIYDAATQEYREPTEEELKEQEKNAKGNVQEQDEEDNEEESNEEDSEDQENNEENEVELPEEMEEADDEVKEFVKSIEDEKVRDEFINQYKEMNEINTKYNELQSKQDRTEADNAPYKTIENLVRQTFKDGDSWDNPRVANQMSEAWNTYVNISVNPIKGVIQALYDISAAHNKDYITEFNNLMYDDSAEGKAKLAQLNEAAKVDHKVWTNEAKKRLEGLNNLSAEYKTKQWNSFLEKDKYGKEYNVLYQDANWKNKLVGQLQAAKAENPKGTNEEWAKAAVIAVYKNNNKTARLKQLESKPKKKAVTKKPSTKEEFNKNKNRKSSKTASKSQSKGSRLPFKKGEASFEDMYEFFKKNPKARTSAQ